MPAREYVDNRVVADSRQYAVDRGIAVDRLAVESALDPYAAYLVFDTFTDIDNTQIDTHTPDKDAVGGGYTIVNPNAAADYKILSNKFLVNENNADWAFAKIDAGNADVIITAELTLGGVNPGIYVRITDEDNCWFCNPSISANVLRIQKRDTGAVTTGASTVQAYVATDVIVLKITLTGNELKAEDLTNSISATVASDNFNNDKTEHGMGGNNCIGTTWEDFAIKAN